MRIIDADRYRKDLLSAYDDISMELEVLDRQPLVPAIPIQKGATNGEMFRAVFGYEPATDSVVCNKEDWCGAGEPCKYCGSNSDRIGREEDWWDKPYKTEQERVYYG